MKAPSATPSSSHTPEDFLRAQTRNQQGCSLPKSRCSF
jgi:hypothetical protein